MATITVKLLEAIRAKNWHEANVLFERTMRERMIARVNDIKTRVMMEDKDKCVQCGSTKNVTMQDGFPLCAGCDPESDLDESEGFENGQKDADVTEDADMNTDCANCDKPMSECTCK